MGAESSVLRVTLHTSFLSIWQKPPNPNPINPGWLTALMCSGVSVGQETRDSYSVYPKRLTALMRPRVPIWPKPSNPNPINPGWLAALSRGYHCRPRLDCSRRWKRSNLHPGGLRGLRFFRRVANLLKPLLVLILRLFKTAFVSGFGSVAPSDEENCETGNERTECSFHICLYYIT